MLTISSRLNVAIVSCTRKRAVTANLKAHKCRGWGWGGTRTDADGTSSERFCICRWVFLKKRKIDDSWWWNVFHAVVRRKCTKRFNDLKHLCMLLLLHILGVGNFLPWKSCTRSGKNAFGFRENSVEYLCQDKETRPARKMQKLIAILIFTTKN